MKLYIQESENLIKFNLPKKVDGALLFSYKSNETGMEHAINIDSQNGCWLLKSNGNINAISTSNNNTVIEQLPLQEYMFIPISVIGKEEKLCIFCLPGIEKQATAYSVDEEKEITIGSNSNNKIVYSQNNTFDKHATIHLIENEWVITPQENSRNCYVYVNNNRIYNSTNIYVGDVIFINGLRIIWMKKFLKLNTHPDLIKINKLNVFKNASVIDNQIYSQVSEAEKNVELYKEGEYFSHTPRIRSIIEEKTVRIDPPPGKQISDQDMPLLLSVGSSFTMLGMTMINGYNIITGLQSGEKLSDLMPSIVMASTMVIGSLIMPLAMKSWQKRMAKKREAKRQKKYGQYLKKKENEISLILKNQAQIIFENNLSIEECQKVVELKSQMLWNREISENDFIEVRVGIGERKADIVIEAPEEKFSLDDDNLYEMVCDVRKKYEKLTNIPITVNLKEEIATAFILNSAFNQYFVNYIMLQLITYHSPIDLKLVIITDKNNEGKWDYARYIPHCWSDDKQIRYFSTSQEDLKIISQSLEQEYNERKNKRKEKEQENSEVSKEKVESYALYDSYYLIITDNFKMLKGFKFIDEILENQNNYGFSMIIIEKNMKHLPKECKKFICVNDTESGIFAGQLKEEEIVKFNAEYDKSLNMRYISQLLGNIPVQGKDAEHQLPNALPFLEMYNVGKIEQLNIRNRWLTSDPIQTLQTPVGVHKNGELFKLDLHEKFDGPHGLIAGSTGSGKSEFIITYILSMALNYDPREVQFVLIDYKGGGLAGAFENREQGIAIPHLAGTITNLDTSEMARTLVSIESELKRRQAKFNEVREKIGESTMDIYKYQRLFREGLIDTPISHLFIISDEFAELKSQQPEFMAQLISTARIGRSLGVHLILATQKPSGVVNDQIWSNSKFKVCLKVQSKADSMEMLKRPEAASIKETGRFYLQVGYDEYFDIGQSAWSGAKYVPVERIIKKIDDSMIFVNNIGNIEKRVEETQKIEVKTEDYGDQLTNIVKTLKKIAEEDNIVSEKLWLPSLDKTILLNNLINKYNCELPQGTFKTVVGEFDAPSSQKQGILTLDLVKDGNILIYGIPGSGKENLITTIIYSLAITNDPRDINFYIGDFGAETLKNLKKFPHVGDVFVTEEKNKLDNLIKMLNKEIERRKKEYSDFGGNFTEYCKLSGKKDPLLVVTLNNYEIFQETFPREQDVFTPFFRDGAKYGIIFILSTTSAASVRSRIAQNFLNKICLKMPNDNDYRDLIGAPRGLIPADNYGRGIVTVDSDFSLEFQTADIAPKENKTQFLREISQELSTKYNNYKAKPIPVLPNIVYVEDVLHELKDLTCVPIGIEKNSLEVYVYNFLEFKINLVAAKSIKNHIYFVYALIKQMLTLKNVKIHVIDALSIYRGNYEGINVYEENIEEGFKTIYQNVQSDKKLKEKNVYFILGVSELENRVSEKYSQHFEALFSQTNKCENNTFIFLDEYEGYKNIQAENWYRTNINNTFGIWLGEDIGTQVALGVMSLSLEDKQLVFPCIGYPIYQGNHMTIKYVVDGVDKEDEE